jgi:cytochrome c oxidase subunit 4|tara:strand:+ start:3237 stop:3566 length:330 start_codon:yes stop_codon:yes gene_type:complete
MSATDTATHDQHLIEETEKYFTFFNLSIFLVIITGVELVLIYIPINSYIIYSSLVALSTVKFLAVIWWFMHLKWDKLLCTVLFLMGLILAAGTITALLFLFEPISTPPI